MTAFDPDYVPAFTEEEGPPVEFVWPTYGLDELEARVNAHADWIEVVSQRHSLPNIYEDPFRNSLYHKTRYWDLKLSPSAEGGSGWAVFAKRLRGINCELDGADLAGSVLDGCKFWNSSFRLANLRGARLVLADVSGCDLFGANLSGANLSGANLMGSDLRGAILTGADLTDANLSRTPLDQAASIEGATFTGATMPDGETPDGILE